LWAIHAQQFDCASTDIGERYNLITGNVPCKVFAPEVLMRMEQNDPLICYWIVGRSSIGLMPIAHWASEAQILERGVSVCGDWHDVFNFERDDGQTFSTAAVSTALGEMIANATSQIGGDILTHELRTFVSSRWIV
jgi:hypothetical protein